MRLFVPCLFEQAERRLVLLLGRQRRERHLIARLIRRYGAEGARRGGGLVDIALSICDAGLALVRRCYQGHLTGGSGS